MKFDASGIDVHETSFKKVSDEFHDSPYIKILDFIKNGKQLVQNAGIKHIDNYDRSIFLTADLCPSRQKLDRYMFENLIKVYGNGRQIPLAIAISGNWLKMHETEFKYLRTLEEKKI